MRKLSFGRSKLQAPGGNAVQVVILCGGLGTRILEVDADLPKPMIPIGGRPILWHIMKSYAQFGFNDFVLCLGYKSWAIKRFFVDYHLSRSDFHRSTWDATAMSKSTATTMPRGIGG